jgi:uncharacterized C2H2 Zn-finger protein
MVKETTKERKVHEKRRDHACPHCAAAFGKAGHLTRHVRTVHEKRKDHACPHCAAAFGEAGKLTKHVRAVHEKRRDHICPHCPSTFGAKGDLKRHVCTVHEKRRDHTCPHCAAAFGLAGDLTKHVRAVHEKRRDHACPHCTAAFGTAGNLTAHVRAVHEKRKDHACPHCDEAFGRAGQLTRHASRWHTRGAAWDEEEEGVVTREVAGRSGGSAMRIELWRSGQRRRYLTHHFGPGSVHAEGNPADAGRKGVGVMEAMGMVRGAKMFALIQGGTVVGLLSLNGQEFEDGRRGAWVSRVVVHTNHRDKGLFRCALRFAADFCCSVGRSLKLTLHHRDGAAAAGTGQARKANARVLLDKALGQRASSWAHLGSFRPSAGSGGASGDGGEDFTARKTESPWMWGEQQLPDALGPNVAVSRGGSERDSFDISVECALDEKKKEKK